MTFSLRLINPKVVPGKPNTIATFEKHDTK